MIFEAKKTGEGTWQVYGSLPENDREQLFVEFASLATICREKPGVLDVMVDAFEFVEQNGGDGGHISVLHMPFEEGGMA